MDQEIGRIPPNIKILGETIVALNILCRNVMIYPRNHPAVDSSLNRVFDLFQKIFEERPNLTVGVGKDGLIIDNYALDKGNASYKQFALFLNKLNIAYVTFLKDLTKDELYAFQQFVSKQVRDLTVDDMNVVNHNWSHFPHLRIGFVDYKRFSIEEGKTVQEIPQENIWEIYIARLAAGTLNEEELRELDEISADIFSNIINKMYEENAGRERAAERIFNLYVKRLLQRPFSNDGIKKLIDFLNGLQSDLKRQFLAILADVLSKNSAVAASSLNNVSPDLVIKLFHAMESREIAIPDNLRNLLDKLLRLAQDENDPLNLIGSYSVDDIFLPSDMLNVLSSSDLKRTIFDAQKTSVSDSYQEEIRELADFSAPERFTIPIARLRQDCEDDAIDKIFHPIILEMMTSDVVGEEEYRQLIQTFMEQTSQFMLTGQYGQILQIVNLLRFNIERNRFTDLSSEAIKYYYSEEFFLSFIDSFKIIGSQAADEARKLCEFIGEMMVPYLINALLNEDSKTFRSLLMGCLKQFGEAVVPEALRTLNDNRWFVKRNMLCLLLGCKNKEIIPHVRPYCRHENRRVSSEAIKCLLSLHDDYAFEVLGEYLHSQSKEDVELAISFIGSFRIREAVADLLQILEGKGAIKVDTELKLLIVRAMGNVGDSGCLEAFRKVLSTKRHFFKKDVEKMQEEIYKTLKTFSYNDIEDIVQLGIKSKNRYISEESSRLMKKGNR
jgi:hypothetical protein